MAPSVAPGSATVAAFVSALVYVGLRYPFLRFVSRMTIHCSDRSPKQVLSAQGSLLFNSADIWAHGTGF